MILELRERLRFIEYCKTQAESSKAIARQLEKMPGPAGEEMVKREKMKAAGYSIVAMELSSISEEYTVGPEDAGEMPSAGHTRTE